MARFKYLGEPPRAAVETYGPTTQIKLRKKNGTIQVVNPPGAASAFTVGADIGVEITCERCIRALNSDIRFELIP